MNKYPHLSSPIEIGGKTFRNRIAAAPNIILRCFEDDAWRPIDDFYGFLTEKARGAAEVMVGDFPVDLEIAPFEKELFEFDERTVREIAKTAAAIHEGGALASIEIIQAGQCCRPAIIKRMLGWKSFIGPNGYTRPEDGVEIVAMDEDMIEKTIENTARVAEVFMRAGFDAILVHGAHSWLINQFFSPLLNHRTDRWGGSFENRCRYPTELLKRIRQKVGSRLLIEYRVNGSDAHEGGNTVEDTIRFLRSVEDMIDVVHVSAGALGIPGEPQGNNTALEPYGQNVRYAAEIKRAGLKPKTIVVGSILTPQMAEALVASGKTDLVAMGRSFVTTPNLPQLAFSGQDDEIVPCMRCMYCMNGELPGAVLEQQHAHCAANPKAYRYRDPRWSEPSPTPKRILVAGGGVSGMEAAKTLRERGHEVILCEAGSELGGIVKFTDSDAVKLDIRNFKNYLINMVYKRGVDVRLNTPVTPELIAELKPDAVFACVGSEKNVPPIKGIEKAVHVLDIYGPDVKIGEKVVIVGGGLAGCETAVHLGRMGHKVTVVEMTGAFAADINVGYIGGLTDALKAAGVEILLSAPCAEITDSGAVIEDGRKLAADTVVYALGMKPRRNVVESLKASGVPVILTGDCIKAGKIKDATHTAFFAALDM